MQHIAEACDQHLLRVNVSMHIASDMKVDALQVMDTKLKMNQMFMFGYFTIRKILP